jgi:Zn-finger nucleic acid-binding protein
MSERSGVEIDYCPECRGVWLDRGELDKILERAESELAAARPAAPASPAAPAAPAEPATGWGTPAPQYGAPVNNAYNDRSYGDRGYDNRDGGHRRKKKESWLSELFD